ncbi:MAG: hypothetical protein RL026_518 [Pseudomonadota bacterium]
MNFVIMLRRQGLLQPLHLSRPVVFAAAGLLLSLIVGVAFSAGLWMGRNTSPGAGIASSGPGASGDGALERQVGERAEALALRIGQINAQLLRIEALGKRLTELAGIDSNEFDFGRLPGTGGTREPRGTEPAADITGLLGGIQDHLDTRDAQLSALEGALLTRRLGAAIRPDGRPVASGYISSHFGERQDPFSGHEANHRGVDFAGKPGSQITAAADGIVSEAGYHRQYGQLVEIRHGNGYSTRYAHNQRVLVRPGDTVRRGQAIALMGSTGRSTGPHVHFEILKDGRHVNPAAYIGG